MSEKSRKLALTRRAFLLGGAGAASYLVARSAPPRSRTAPATVTRIEDARLAAGVVPDYHLAATDGWATMPVSAMDGWTDVVADQSAQQQSLQPFWPDLWAADYDHPDQNLYIFGFRDVSALTDAQVAGERGNAQISAPQLSFDEDTDYRVQLSNLGLSARPDLVDGHTIHWHGFVNAMPVFDGVPELSISVPIGRSFTYFYRPHDAGTYMYHCHFEDVEHVQMGMTGLLFVRPKQNGNTALYPSGKFAYNCGDGSTGYDREFGLFLTEIFAEGHWRDAHVQTTDWTDFKASFWCINGRSYPDTVEPSANWNGKSYDPLDLGDLKPQLKYQPQSALVTCNAGDRVLLRFASLGYQSHVMTADNLPLTQIAKDAYLLKNNGVTHYLDTNAVEVGAGESADVLFTAPAYDAALPGGTDSRGDYNTYLLYDRNLVYTSNGGNPASPGGMATEIRVYPGSTLPDQTQPNA